MSIYDAIWRRELRQELEAAKRTGLWFWAL